MATMSNETRSVIFCVKFCSVLASISGSFGTAWPGENCGCAIKNAVAAMAHATQEKGCCIRGFIAAILRKDWIALRELGMRVHGLAVCCIVAAAFVAVNALDPPRVRSGEPLRRFEFSQP